MKIEEYDEDIHETQFCHRVMVRVAEGLPAPKDDSLVLVQGDESQDLATLATLLTEARATIDAQLGEISELTTDLEYWKRMAGKHLTEADILRARSRRDAALHKEVATWRAQRDASNGEVVRLREGLTRLLRPINPDRMHYFDGYKSDDPKGVFCRNCGNVEINAYHR